MDPRSSACILAPGNPPIKPWLGSIKQRCREPHHVQMSWNKGDTGESRRCGMLANVDADTDWPMHWDTSSASNSAWLPLSLFNKKTVAY